MWVSAIMLRELICAIKGTPAGPKMQIPFSVIKVPVGIDHEIDTIRTQAGQGCFDLGHELGKLVVHQQRSVFANADQDIPAYAKQRVKPFAQLLDLDLCGFKIPAECFDQLIQRQGLLRLHAARTTNQSQQQQFASPIHDCGSLCGFFTSA
jgi:hypothetical protein